MTYTIGQVAQKMGLTAHTLRYYDKEGLLPFVDRSPSGIRRFKDEDFEWLSIINCMKDTGMPIKEIKKYIDLCMQGDFTIDLRLQIIQNQKEKVAKDIKIFNKYLQKLKYKEWYYQTAKEAGTLAIHTQAKPQI